MQRKYIWSVYIWEESYLSHRPLSVVAGGGRGEATPCSSPTMMLLCREAPGCHPCASAVSARPRPEPSSWCHRVTVSVPVTRTVLLSRRRLSCPGKVPEASPPTPLGFAEALPTQFHWEGSQLTPNGHLGFGHSQS